MRILDRYLLRQLVPVLLWCLAIFLFLTVVIDLFGHLDEILRYKVPVETVLQFYLSFLPIVFIRATPIALLLACAFVAGNLARHNELLAIHSSGTHPLRTSMPFLFLGWIAALSVFFVGDLFLPKSSLLHQEIREEAFRVEEGEQYLRNVALMDGSNRLYHARLINREAGTAEDMQILEHDENNRPVRSFYAQRAEWMGSGWTLYDGAVHRIGPGGEVLGEPEPFRERFLPYRVTPDAFSDPGTGPQTMNYRELRTFIARLRHSGSGDLKRYELELASKFSMPFTNVVMCLIAFIGATQPSLRGTLKGLGMTLIWGLAYYLFVATFQSVTKVTPIPAWLGAWLPHLLVAGVLLGILQTRR